MHWLQTAATRAGFPSADTILMSPGLAPAIAWSTLERGLSLSSRDLAARLAPALGVQAANLDAGEPRALALLPERLARRFVVYPLREDDRTITVACGNPNDLDTEQAISFASGRRVIFELASPHAISEAIAIGYSPDRVVEKLLRRGDGQTAAAVRVTGLPTAGAAVADGGTGPVVELTTLIIRDAIALGATDVHLEPDAKGGSVRLRIDDVMRVHMQLPIDTLPRIVSRLKVMARLDITDRRRPQSGHARVNVGADGYDLRVSTIPTGGAEKAVLRILRPDAAATLSSVGFGVAELAQVRELLAGRRGIVAVVGPAGCGRTTTVYAMLREMAAAGLSITTIEDPIEYDLAGIAQMHLDVERGVTHASALRAVLAQHPDAVFVGELADAETARMAAQASLAGQLVLTTLRANHAFGAVTRLHEIGLDLPSIAASLRGSIAQRLIRKLCSECGGPTDDALTPDEERLATGYGLRPPMRAAGCRACGNTGFRGRLLLAEVAVMTPDISELIAGGAAAATLARTAAGHGMRSLRDGALARVRAGETTLQEVERMTGDDPLGRGTAPGGIAVVPAAVPVSDAPAPPRVFPLGGEPASQKPRILVVDDDSVMRLLAGSLLRSAGYLVETANDGVEALRQLSSGTTFDLMVTDLHMPKLNGTQLLAAVRESTVVGALPVIVFTQSEEFDEEAQLMDAGADDYIRKPINPERFVARVRAALRRANL